MVLSLLADIRHSLTDPAFLVTLSILKVLGCKIAVFIQSLPVRYNNPLSGVGLYRKLHISGQILPIIDHDASVRRLQKLSLKTLVFCHWHTVGAAQICCPKVLCLYQMPISDFLQPGIHCLALLHVIFPHRTCLRGLPAFIGNADRLSVYLQLKIQSHVLPVKISFSVHSGTAAVPAVAQDYLYPVFSLSYQLRHIIGLICQPPVIGVTPGSQNKISHSLSVDPCLIQPMTGNIQPGRPFSIHLKGPAQIAGRLVDLGVTSQLRVDPFCCKLVFFQKPHFKKSFFAPFPGHILLIPQAYLPGNPLSACRLHSQKIIHSGRSYLSAVPDHLSPGKSLDFIGCLLYPAPALPGQIRFSNIDSQRICHVFCLQKNCLHIISSTYIPELPSGFPGCSLKFPRPRARIPVRAPCPLHTESVRHRQTSHDFPEDRLLPVQKKA